MTCKLINGVFSWIMEVDGMEISFTGRDCAEYFAMHYGKLGYKVIFDESEWKK